MNQTVTGLFDISMRDNDVLLQTDLHDSHVCPICGGDSELRFVKKGFPIRDCIECDHRFAGVAVEEDHVERVYADSYFQGSAGGYPDYLADREILISRGERYARMLDQYMEPGTILDVGAAGGFILKGFEKMGWSGQGLEPNPAMAAYAQQQLGVSVDAGTLEETRIGGQYDMVAMIQVVPHFIDPRQALEVANKKTKPGGYWLIETWNRDSWTARVLGKAWHEYNPPSVLHWFSIRRLRELVESYGLREITRGRPLKWISPLHARAVAQAQSRESALSNLIAVGTRLIPERIPLPYLLDDVFWGLYRKPGPDDVH